MKKLVVFFTLIIAVFILFTGCTNNLNLLEYNSKKQNKFYYTNILVKKLKQEMPSKCIITETNFHKEKPLDKETIKDVKDMFESLNQKNFINTPKNISNKKPFYKIIIEFKQEKFLVNIYSSTLVSVYPWDGIYSMDYIDTSKIPISLNLYSLGKYIFKQ
jgi:hypothetical protein